MSGGLLLIIAGVWVGTQVLGGDALKRLGIRTATRPSSANVDPKTGVPNQDPTKPLITTPGPLVGQGQGVPY